MTRRRFFNAPPGFLSGRGLPDETPPGPSGAYFFSSFLGSSFLGSSFLVSSFFVSGGFGMSSFLPSSFGMSLFFVVGMDGGPLGLPAGLLVVVVPAQPMANNPLISP